MSYELSIQCGNCGTTLQVPAAGATTVQCPVCRFVNDVSSAAQPPMFTRESLEHSLGALIEQARAGGLTSDEIVATLRDELEFAADLAHFGRHMCVQIIDLGPQEVQGARLPVRDRSSLLRGRSLGD
jgi:LSD1 subclass zinc finger protein